MSSFLDEICSLLDTYKGRDKFLRTLCYSCKLIGGLHGDAELAKKFLYVSRHMSSTRATLRLFDDLPMLKFNMEYGLGQSEPDKFMAALGVTTNIIDQIYFPVEKIAWLFEHKLLTSQNASKWDTLSSVCWILSIYLTLVKNIRLVMVLQKHKNCFGKGNDERISLEKMVLKQNFELITCVRLSLDLVHAINTLPPGFLWSSKLENWHVGLIGTVSSVLGLYQCFAKKKL